MSEQAVTNSSNAPDNQVTEGSGAQEESLDELLSQFDSNQETPKPAEQPQASNIDDVVSYVNEERQRRQAEEEEADIKKAVTELQSGIKDGDLSYRMTRGFLEAYAVENPSVKKAFEYRHQNPRAWELAQRQALKELKDEISIDNKATQTSNDLAAAVHSASTSMPETETPNFSEMTDLQFQMYKKGLRKG